MKRTFSEALDEICWGCREKAAFHRMGSHHLFCLQFRETGEIEERRWEAAVAEHPLTIYIVPTKYLMVGTFGGSVHRILQVGLNEWVVPIEEGEQQRFSM